MSSSNIADLNPTASPALQNWITEWGAAENGKSYWDDYISQIIADYDHQIEDIDLALQAPKAKYDAAIEDINLDLQAPQVKYDKAISSIELDVQSSLNRLQNNYDRAKLHYDAIKLGYDNETYAEVEKNNYDAAIADIDIYLQNQQNRLQDNFDRAKSFYDLTQREPDNYTFDEIDMAEMNYWMAEEGLYMEADHYRYMADEDKESALSTYNSEKEAARLIAEREVEYAEMNYWMAEEHLYREADLHRYVADEDKESASSTYNSEKEAAELAALDETAIAEATYNQELAAAEALAEQQKIDALDDYSNELTAAESARDSARSVFFSQQEAAAEAEAAAIALAEKAAAEAEAAAIAAEGGSDNQSADRTQPMHEVDNAQITLDQRHSDVSGGDFLELSYALKGNDLTGNPGGDASSLGVNADGLTNVAVLGPNTSSTNSYTLEISAESLQAGWNLESTDIALKYNADIFGEITANDITIDGVLSVKNSLSIDDENGLIRFAAASLSDLGKGSSILGKNILASINLDFEDSYFQDTARNPDANGKFTFDGNPLGFELSANSDETIFSRTFQSDAKGQEIGGSQSFDISESEFVGSNIEVISSTKYWAGQQDILHFNTNLDNPNGVKSVVISEQIDNKWVDIVSKSAYEIYEGGDSLPGSISWAYKSLEDNIGRSSVFGDNALRIQAIYEDTDGNTHATNSYFDKSANTDWAVNQTYNIDSSESFILDIDTFTNREIKSLGDLNGGTVFDKSDVNLYQAEIKFSEEDGGLTFGTNRVIGANQSFTNLIRKGDIVTAETSIENIGNSLAKNVSITDAGLVSNADYTSSRFLDSNGNELINNTTSPINLSGGVFDEKFNYDSSSQESVNFEIGMHITGAAGSVIDVSKGLFQVSASGMIQNPDTTSTPEIFISGSGSKNLITYQGDLNYDGRVSMKDLAYLNAGAARQELVDGTDDIGNVVQVASEASYARDVDADFSGKIDIADLAILDNDWGKSLHVGDQDFLGSAEVSWNDLDGQGDNSTWDNSSFKEQNSIEADVSYVGSLEAPGSSGVIGSDGYQDGSNSLEGESFQDPLNV